MNDFHRRWDETRRVWRGRTQRYSGDPVGAIGVLRRRLATRIGGVDTGASVSIEYSLPVLSNAPWLIDRAVVDGTEFAQCPDTCSVNPPLSHVYTTRSNYVLSNVLVDTRSGFVYADHLGRPSLIRESTSWPASQALWSVTRPGSGIEIDTPLTILSTPSNYFHFMTEDFPALLRVLEMWPDVEVGVRRGPRAHYVDDALLSVGKFPIELDRIVSVKTLLMAGRGQDLGQLRSEDRQRVYTSILGNREIASTEKNISSTGIFYAARGQATRATELENQAIATVNSRHGTVVDFSQLSVSGQAELASQARIFAGNHGAALTNALFSEPGTTIIELIPSDYHNRCYEWISHICKLNYVPCYSTQEFSLALARSYE